MWYGYASKQFGKFILSPPLGWVGPVDYGLPQEGATASFMGVNPHPRIDGLNKEPALWEWGYGIAPDVNGTAVQTTETMTLNQWKDFTWMRAAWAWLHLLHPAVRTYVRKVLTGLQGNPEACLLYTSPSPRDRTRSRMPSSA